MTITIVNPFLKPYSDKNYPITWTWEDHIRNGYYGGTDYGVPPGHPIVSPADGTAVVINDGLNGIGIVLHDGRTIIIREATVRVGRFPRPVSLGERIGITGRLGNKFPHIEGESVGGTRIRFEPMVTQASSPAGGGSTPIDNQPVKPKSPQEAEVTDLIYYVTVNSTDGKIVKDSMYYQECVGAPLFPFTGGKPYNTGNAAIYEYQAFVSRYGDIPGIAGIGDSSSAARFPMSGDGMQLLIALRGLTNKPIGNFNSASGPVSGDLGAAVSAINTHTDAAVETIKVPTKVSSTTTSTLS